MLLIRGENVVALGEIVSIDLSILLTKQDLIAEDEVPLRQIGLDEMRQKLAESEVSFCMICF